MRHSEDQGVSNILHTLVRIVKNVNSKYIKINNQIFIHFFFKVI